MKSLLLSFCFALSLSAADPAVREVKAVYLLPMAYGLDQYLASKLTSEGVVQVVTDPLKADAVITDKVGQALERKMQDLYAPKPEPPKEEKKDEAKSEKTKKDEAKKDIAKQEETAAQARVGTSSWGRGRGTVFIVQRATGNVIWSTTARPKDSSAPSVIKLAGQIAARIKKDRTEVTKP